jgi:hypothetical protein
MLCGTSVWAQTMGGGGASSGGGSFGSGSGGAGTSSGGFSSNFATGAGSGTPGSTAGFSGNLDVGTAFGSTTGQGAGAGRVTGVPTTANPFQAFYANPQALGQQLITITTTTGGTANTVPAFGQPIYATTTTTAGTTTGLGGTGGVGIGAGLTTGPTGGLGAGTLGAGRGTTIGGVGGTTLGGVGGVGGAGLGGAGLGGVGLGGAGATGATVVSAIPLAGFSTIGSPRIPTYITVLGFTPPASAARTNGRLRADVQDVVARSSALSARGIQVSVDGEVVVLRGVVPDEHQARLAEGVIRLTPGVREVRNELVVRQ